MKGCSGKILNLVKPLRQTVPGGPVYSAASSPASPAHTAHEKPKAETFPSQDAEPLPGPIPLLGMPFPSLALGSEKPPLTTQAGVAPGLLHQDVGLTDLYVRRA